VEKAAYQRLANAVGVVAHFTGCLVHGAALKQQQYLPGHGGKRFRRQSDGADELEPLQLGQEIIDSRLARIGFEPLDVEITEDAGTTRNSSMRRRTSGGTASATRR
jgi:hypothetical protein